MCQKILCYYYYYTTNTITIIIVIVIVINLLLFVLVLLLLINTCGMPLVQSHNQILCYNLLDPAVSTVHDPYFSQQLCIFQIFPCLLHGLCKLKLKKNFIWFLLILGSDLWKMDENLE